MRVRNIDLNRNVTIESKGIKVKLDFKDSFNQTNQV